MSIPAMIFCGLVLVGLGQALANDGKPKTGNQSFVQHVIAVAIICALLYAGGFFDQVR